MKKYILTEKQVKTVIDTLINEESSAAKNKSKTTVNEQEEEINLRKAIQCFLNKRFNAKLPINGVLGPETSKLITKLQNIKKFTPSDGQWSQDLRAKLTPQELDMMKDCTAEVGDFVDKTMRFIGKNF